MGPHGRPQRAAPAEAGDHRGVELTLLGTAAPSGLPRIDCPCAVCALSVGDLTRAPTAVLVDGAVLLDLTPAPAFAIARAGHPPQNVCEVLLASPGDGPEPGELAGLPTPVRLPAGEELVTPSGHRVRAVPLDVPGTGYAITGPDDRRLLLLPAHSGPRPDPEPGPDSAAPPDATTDWGGRSGWEATTAQPPGHPADPYDVVLLDVLGRPDALAELRARGEVTSGTEVLAVHLDHHVPPGEELRRRLAAWGTRAEPDGAVLRVGTYPKIRTPRRTLVLGGARSGKSVEAERRLAGTPEVLYVATGGARDGDPEWAERIRTHRARRPTSWRTVETCDLAPLLTTESSTALLVDCLALWLTDALDRADAWDEETWRTTGRQALARRTAELVAAVRAARRPVVMVSNEVGAGVVPSTVAGRRFQDELGRLNAAVAAECEEVWAVVAGVARPLRC